MLRSTIQLTLFSILGIVINFVIQLALAYFFGTSESRDAYYAAMTIPSYAAVVFNGSIGMVLVPFIIKHTLLPEENGNHDITSETLNFTFIILTAIVILCCIYSYPIVRLIVPGDKTRLLELTVHLFRILMLNTLFIVLNNLLSSEFHSRRSYLYPAAVPIITSTISLVAVLIASRSLGIYSLAYGTLAGSILSFIYLFVNLQKKFSYKWKHRIHSRKLNKLLIAAFPLFSSGILFRSITVLERYFAARLSPGSLSYLGNGNQIMLILATIISSGIATTSYPLLSKYWAENNLADFRTTFKKGFDIIILIMFPTIVLFSASGRDVITILFEHGAFNNNDTNALYNTLLGLMGSLLFASLGNIVSKILYISNNTKVAGIIALIKVVIYIISAIVLTQSLDYVGLAVSLSICDSFSIICSLLFIQQYITDINIMYLIKRMVLIVAISILIYIFVYLFQKYIFATSILILRPILAALLISFSFWGIFTFIIKDEYYIAMNTVVKRKLFSKTKS